MALNAFGYMRRKIYPHYTIRSNTETYVHSHQGQNFYCGTLRTAVYKWSFFYLEKNAQTVGFYKLSVLPSPSPGIFEKVAPVPAVLTLHANAISKTQFNLKYCTL